MHVLFLNMSEIFLILMKIQRDITTNLHSSSCKCPLCQNVNKILILSIYFRKILIQNFMKIRLVKAEFFHAD